MELVKATQSQVEQAYYFICELENHPLHHDVFKQLWKQNLDDATLQYYFLKDHDVFVGFCSLRVMYPLHHCARVAQIEEFIVDKNMRRQGFGSYMFFELCQVAKQFDCCLLELSSRDVRKGAHAFYQKQGMERIHYKFTMKLT